MAHRRVRGSALTSRLYRSGSPSFSANESGTVGRQVGCVFGPSSGAWFDVENSTIDHSGYGTWFRRHSCGASAIRKPSGRGPKTSARWAWQQPAQQDRQAAGELAGNSGSRKSCKSECRLTPSSSEYQRLPSNNERTKITHQLRLWLGGRKQRLLMACKGNLVRFRGALCLIAEAFVRKVYPSIV